MRRVAAVDLVVSRGPRPVKVPDLTGEDADRAARTLRKAGFEVRVSRENSDSVPQGDLISQAPNRGTLFKGETVRLLVSKGPVLVDVPDVRRMSVDDARNALRDAGFEVREEKIDLYVGLGLVVKQSPSADDKAPRGSAVTIFVV